VDRVIFSQNQKARILLVNFNSRYNSVVVARVKVNQPVANGNDGIFLSWENQSWVCSIAELVGNGNVFSLAALPLLELLDTLACWQRSGRPW